MNVKYKLFLCLFLFAISLEGQDSINIDSSIINYDKINESILLLKKAMIA